METDSLLSTSRLFHYTDTRDKLVNILKNGFRPRYCLEKLDIIRKDEFFEALSKYFDKPIPEEEVTDEFAIPMCCFCDIPLNLVRNHMVVYGNYAIGLKKEWGERQAICPVLYVPKEGETRFLFEMMLRYTHRLIPQLEERQQRIKAVPLEKRNIANLILGIDLINYLNYVINLMMYIKPYSGNYQRKNGYKAESYKFYDEREWRYKPSVYLARQFLSKEEYLDKKLCSEANEALGSINFTKDDITDIICPSDDIEFLRTEIQKIDSLRGINPELIDVIENKPKVK